MNKFALSLCSVDWLMEPRSLQALIAQVGALTETQIQYTIRAITEKSDLLARLHAQDFDGPINRKRRALDITEDDLDIRDGEAHIEISGPMMRQVPSVFNWLGIPATSTDAVRQELALAIESDKVKTIVLNIDSPGGTVDGTKDLADDVAAAASLKPISVQVGDMMASAAMWVGAQAPNIVAGPTSSVGSIGVYTVIDDEQAKYVNEGIHVHVIASHELKGIGVEGSAVTPLQLADLQRNIDTLYELFVTDVAQGRRMKRKDVEKIATGQVWIGQEAVEIGLVDRIRENAALSAVKQRKEKAMTVEEQKELEALRAKNAALEAEKKEALAQAEKDRVAREVAEATQKEGLLARFSSRIPPAARGSVERLVADLSYDEALEYLEGLPEVERAIRQSGGAIQDLVETARASGPLTVEERSACKAFGQSPERLRDMIAIGEVAERVEYDRELDEKGKVKIVPKIVLKDGERVTKAELRKRLGLKGALMGLALAICLLPGDAFATALSAARATECKWTGRTKVYLMEASETIYAGSLVMIDSDGEAVPAAAEASNNNVAGVAQETKTAAATGSTWIRVSDGVLCKFAGTTLGQDDVGSAVYAEDDQTVDETVGSNEPIAGVLIQYVSASEAWIYVDSAINFGRVNVSQPIVLTADLTLANAEVIDNDTDDLVCLVGSGGTSDEDICFDLDGTNVVALSSTTSAAELDFGSFTTFTLGNDETIKNDNNGEIELGNGTEDTAFSWGTNTVVLSTDTDVAEFDFGAVGTTLKLANDQTIVSDTDGEIQFADGSEDISLGFGTSNTVIFTSDTGVVIMDLAAVGTTITLANDQTIVSDTDNEIQFGDNSEDVSFGFGTANTLTLSTDTDVAKIDLGAVGTTLDGLHDQQIVFDTDNEIQFGDNSEDIAFNFATENVLTITTDTGVTKVDFGTLNLETDGTFQILGSGATIGWASASAANTACSTTCAGTGACVIGYDTGGNTFVDCDAATADTCVCAGPAA